MPRFVILEHDHPELHWDLMLEAGDVLHTWRLAHPPIEPGCEIVATAFPDHRRMYLDYEGPVGGNRGTVRRWDWGDFEEAAESLPNVRLIFLRGMHIRREIRLEQVNGAEWSFRG